MTLKVIGAGLGRTGTHSTQLALNQLGFPCYHMTEVILNKDNKPHLDFWRKVANAPPGTQQNWESIFARYTATVDNPGCCVWRELMAAYPDAKVLLTLHPRGAEAWYESTMRDDLLHREPLAVQGSRTLDPVRAEVRRHEPQTRLGRTLKGVMDDKAKAVARYDAYVGEVKAAVPPEKLLIFKVTDGWEPLCAFLGVAAPNTKFPNVNDRAQFQKLLAGVMMGAYVILTGIAVAAVIVLGGAYWLLR